MAFTFEVADNALVITNGDVTPKVRIALADPTVELAGIEIRFYDKFIWQRTFRFIDFGTIDGVVPTDIEDAYDKLLVLQNAVNAANETTLPAGAATAANQVTLINQGTGTIQSTYSAESLPYTVPAGVNSYSIITQGSVAADGVTVPEGRVFENSHPSQDGTVLSPAFTDVAAGSLLVTLGIKV